MGSVGKVTCRVCKKELEQITHTHVKTHEMTLRGYQDKFPSAPIAPSGKFGVKCKTCGIIFYVPKWRKSRGDATFCSKECMSKWNSEYFRGANNPFYGKHHSEEFGKNRKKLMDELFLDSTFREYHSRKTKEGMKKAKEHGVVFGVNLGYPEMVEKKLKAFRDPEYRKKRSKITRGLWQNPNFVRSQMKARNVVPNKKEIKLLGILPKIWKYVGDGELIIGGKCPDYSDGGKKLIELFGDYWHKDDNPQERIDFFKKYGYSCLVIWEHELKDKDILLKKVINFAPI